MPKHAEKHEPHHPQHHTTTPRQRAWVITFVVVAAALFGGMLFLATGTSRIAFTWTPQPVEGTATFSVAATPAGDDVAGAFLEKSVEVSKVFTAEEKTPTETVVPTFTGKARGRATITNRYTKAQPLQAGTRLKTKDGQIFRTQARVDVPVGGSVTTLVIADVAGEQGAVKENTTFILPGLWAGLQDKITGVAAENFYGENTTTTATGSGLTATELANAELALQAEAVEKTLPDLQALVPTGRVLNTGMTQATTTKRTGPAIGDQKQSYTLTLTVKVTGVAVDSAKVEDIATSLLTTTLAPDLQLLDLDPATFGYTVTGYDAKKQRAEVSLVARGATTPAPSHALLQHATYAGKSADQVRSLLGQEKAVSSVVVDLAPFWNRQVPTSASDLQLEVTRAE